MRRMFFAAVFVAIWITAAPAQTYPTKPITLVVPFAAGGPSDIVGRMLAERMKTPLGQPIIVENVGGAAGSIAVGRVARAPSDGYTLILGIWGTHVVNGAIYDLPYHVMNDFAPIGMLAVNPSIIVTKKEIPADDLKGLIAWLKANPDKASQGTSGVGSAGHVAGVFFQSMTGTRFQFVPYRGLAPAMQDLVAGQIDMMIDIPASSLPQLREGRIKAYAITAPAEARFGTRNPDRRRGGIARALRFRLVCPVGAQSYADGHRRQAQCRAGGGAGGAGSEPAVHGTRPRHSATHPADAGFPRRPSPGRDREMVADHQGGRHPRAMRRCEITGVPGATPEPNFE